MIRPFYLDLTEQEIEDIQAKLGLILRSGTLILGKHTEAFEHEFARYVGTQVCGFTQLRHIGPPDSTNDQGNRRKKGGGSNQHQFCYGGCHY